MKFSIILWPLEEPTELTLGQDLTGGGNPDDSLAVGTDLRTANGLFSAAQGFE